MSKQTAAKINNSGGCLFNLIFIFDTSLSTKLLQLFSNCNVLNK